MSYDDVLDEATVSRIEHEHDCAVKHEAYEIHVADLASMPLSDRLRAVGAAGGATVHLITGEVVRGRVAGTPPGWLILDHHEHQMLVALSAVMRLSLTSDASGAPRTSVDIASSRGLGSSLREHLEVSGRVRLWFRDGLRTISQLESVCADFLVVDGGVLVPLHALDVVELV
jgi:hypothetical protein